MIKEKIISNLEIYAETYNKATELWENVRNQIMREYKEDFQADRLSSAKDVYEKTLSDARNEIMGAIDDVLDSVKSKVVSVTEKEIPEAFEPTLNIIKNLEKPTKSEVESISGMYFKNYLCYRSLCDVLKQKGYNLPVVKLDDILADIESLRNEIKKAVFGSSPEAYTYKALMHGELLESYESRFNMFLDGRFEEMSDDE